MCSARGRGPRALLPLAPMRALPFLSPTPARRFWRKHGPTLRLTLLLAAAYAAALALDAG